MMNGQTMGIITGVLGVVIAGGFRLYQFPKKLQERLVGSIS